MLMMIALGLATAQPAPPTTDRDVLNRMATVFYTACLRTFPDDDAVAATMSELHAAPLAPEQLRRYLHDAQGRGWSVVDGQGRFVVTIATSPDHTCSLQRTVHGGFADLAKLESIFEPYERDAGGFTKMQPVDRQLDRFASHLTGYEKLAAGGGGEALYLALDSINDPVLYTEGNSPVIVRVMHRFVPPGAR